MALNDIIVPKENAQGDFTETVLTPAEIGAQPAGNYATLVGGTVPANQLPSYVDDVIEVANAAARPNPGETGKIYITTDNNKVFRWSGSAYVEIVASPGSTDAVPEGSTNLYHTTQRAAAAAPVQSVAGRTGAVTLAVADVTDAVATSDARLSDARTPTSHTHGNLTNDGKIGTTSGLPIKTGTAGVLEAGSFGTSAGTFCEGNDARLSDARTPSSTLAHASSHAAGGSDPVFDQDLNTSDSAIFAGLQITTAGSPSVAKQVLLADDEGTVVGITGNEADARASLGLGNSATLDTGTTAGTVAAGDHTHELNALDATGATDGHVLTADGAGGAAWEALPASGVSGVAASAGDVLGVSGSNITGVDAGADRIVFWDDSAGELTYLEAGSGLSISGTTMTVTATGGATNLWIPASAWIPRTTSGCGVDSREIGSTNRQNFDELLFDTGSEEFAQAFVVMPSNYNNSTLTARFYWTASSGSGGVAWGISGRAFGDDDAIDQATGTRIVVTDTLLASNDVHVTSATSAVTINGTPAANKAINFQISRVVADSADTLAVDARFLGAEIIFN